MSVWWQIAEAVANRRAAVSLRLHRAAVQFASVITRVLACAVALLASVALARAEAVDASAPVEIQLLVRPEHASQTDRFEAAVRIAATRLSDWFGPHSRARLTVVDVPWTSPLAGHAEGDRVYTTTRLIAPAGGMELERPTVRAVAESYWQPAIGAQFAWLVGDLADYSAAKIVPELFSLAARRPGYAYAGDRYFGGFVPWIIRSAPIMEDSRIGHHVWIQTLERYIGWPAMQAILSEVHRRGVHAPMTPGDLRDVAETTTGRDLEWLFAQVAPQGPAFDYGVEHLSVDTVVVRRYGDGIFAGTSAPRAASFDDRGPIEIAVTFADGRVVEERWDGRDRFKTFSYDAPASVRSAEVDPRDVIRLDAHRTNNSRSLAPSTTRASAKWAIRWMIWLQNYLLTCAALV